MTADTDKRITSTIFDRSTAVNFGSSFARVGSVIAGLVAMLHLVNPVLPYIIYGLLALIAGLLDQHCFWLSTVKYKLWLEERSLRSRLEGINIVWVIKWVACNFKNCYQKYLLRLSYMLYYALCLSYHSNIKAALFACLSSGWATTTGRLLGPKVGNRNLSITSPAPLPTDPRRRHQKYENALLKRG